MTGSLKRNDKAGVETRPDYRGKITLLDGQEFWVSGWVNEDRDSGEKYLSLKLKPKEEQPQQTAAQSSHDTAKGNAYQPQIEEDDLPF